MKINKTLVGSLVLYFFCSCILFVQKGFSQSCSTPNTPLAGSMPTSVCSPNIATATAFPDINPDSSFVDQQNTSEDGGGGGMSAWQSFTPSVSGTLTSFQWYMSCPIINGGAQNCRAYVFEGEGDGGKMLGKNENGLTPPYSSFRVWQSFDLSDQHIFLMSGNKYTIKIVISSQNVGWLETHALGAYPAQFGRGDLINTDYCFKTFMDTTKVVWYDAPVMGNVVNNPTLSTVGSVTFFAEAQSGSCKSQNRASVTLTVSPSSQHTTTASICNGDTYTFNGQTITNAGTYTIHLTNAAGCDSTVTLILKTNATRNVVPSISIISNKNSINPGKTVTFTAYPSNGGSSPSFQWVKNNTPFFDTSLTYIDNNLQNGDIIYCILNSNSFCRTSDSATSNRIVMRVSSQPLHLQTFSPHIASVRTKVIITGSGFTSVNRVLFDGVDASSFQVLNDNTISAIVGNGSTASGTVSVLTSNSGDTATGFLYSTLGTGSYSLGMTSDLAGTGVAGNSGDGGTAINATFDYPTGVVMDNGCKNLYVVDTKNNRVRVIGDNGGSFSTGKGSKVTFSILPSKPVSKVPSGGASPNSPGGASISRVSSGSLVSSNTLFVTDTKNNRILSVDKNGDYYIAAGSKNAIAGFDGDKGVDTLALFDNPVGIVADKHFPYIYVADQNNNRIRKIDLSTDSVTTFAGNGGVGYDGDEGLATDAILNKPTAIDIDDDGNLYIADTYNNCIRMVDVDGFIHTVVGTGIAGNTDLGIYGLTTQLDHPMGVSCLPNGNVVISDTYNNRIRVLTTNGNLYTLTGTDNDTTGAYFGNNTLSNTAKLSMPMGVTWDTSGGGLSIYFADANNNRIRSVDLTSTIANNVWTGAVSTDWNNRANWSNSVLPTTIGTVTIPFGVANKPTCTSAVVVDTLILNGDLEFKGQALTINGPLYGTTGYLHPNSSSTLHLNGNTGILYFDGTDNDLGNLVSTGNVELGSSLNLYNHLAIKNGSFLTDDSLTLKSTSIVSSAVVDSVGGSISGKVTVERFIPQGIRAFRDLGAGVANAGSVFDNWQEKGIYNNGFGMLITGSKGSSKGYDPIAGLDYSQTGNHSMFSYINGVWDSVMSTKNTAFDVYQGFRALVRGGRDVNVFQYPQPTSMLTPAILRSKGQLVTGKLTITTQNISGSFPSSYHLTRGDSAFTFLANPYVSPIDWNSIWKNSSSISSSYTYADPTFLGNDGLMTYVTYNALSQMSSNPLGSDINQFIQPNQGFFVQNATGGTPTLIIDESDRAPLASHTSIFSTGGNVNAIAFGLNRGLANVDGAVVAFSPNYSKRLGLWDSYKFNNGAENIAFNKAGTNVSIAGSPMPTIKDTLPITLYGISANNAYSLRVDVSKFYSNGLMPFVLDRLTNKTTLLQGDSNIVLFTPTIDPKTYYNRFSLIFRTGVLPIENISLNLVKEKQGVTVSWIAFVAGQVEHFVVERSFGGGKFEAIANLGSNTFSFKDNTKIVGKAIYRIRVESVDEPDIYSPSCAISGGSPTDGISIFPNPVEGQSFTLQLMGIEKGTYSLQIFGVNGGLVFEKTINHLGEVASYGIFGPKLLAGGYSLLLKDSKGNVYQQKLIVN